MTDRLSCLKIYPLVKEEKCFYISKELQSICTLYNIKVTMTIIK